MWDNLVRLGIPAKAVVHLHRLWSRYRITRGPAHGYYSKRSEHMDHNGDRRHARAVLPSEYCEGAHPLQFPSLDQRLHSIPAPQFTKPRKYRCAPEIWRHGKACKCADELDQQKNSSNSSGREAVAVAPSAEVVVVAAIPTNSTTRAVTETIESRRRMSLCSHHSATSRTVSLVQS